jgi:hypothetical protein
MNVCGACGLDFGSVQAFDLHRVGKHEPLTRRCLTLEELAAKGFVQNHYGRWTTAEALERGRTRNPHNAETPSSAVAYPYANGGAE